MAKTEQKPQITEDKELQLVGLELMFYAPDKFAHKDGLTTIEIAKRVNLKTDIVKKKLKVLCEKNIVRCTGINPKYWKFDEYNFLRMNEDDFIYGLLCNYDDVDFCRYYKY